MTEYANARINERARIANERRRRERLVRFIERPSVRRVVIGERETARTSRAFYGNSGRVSPADAGRRFFDETPHLRTGLRRV